MNSPFIKRLLEKMKEKFNITLKQHMGLDHTTITCLRQGLRRRFFMALLRKMTEILRGNHDRDDRAHSGEEPSSSFQNLFQEKRTHDRFHLAFPGYFYVEFPNKLHKLRASVINISYGGLRVSRPSENQRDFPSPDFSLSPDEPLSAKISVLDKKCEVSLKLIDQTSAYASFRLIHKDPKSLIFLRDYLENFYFGSSLKPLNKEMIQEKYKSPEWIWLRGDGPTDMILKKNISNNGAPKSPLSEAMLTFMEHEKYHELKYKNGSLSTAISLDQQGTSTRMGPTDQIDLSIVRRALSIILGMCSEDTHENQELLKTIRPFFDAGLEALNIKYTD